MKKQQKVKMGKCNVSVKQRSGRIHVLSHTFKALRVVAELDQVDRYDDLFFILYHDTIYETIFIDL